MAIESPQSHPLYALDRNIVDGLLAAKEPTSGQMVDAARLFNRYQGFPGATDLKEDLEKTLRLWGFDRNELNRRCRELWSTGYLPGEQLNAQPGSEVGPQVGSGFDTTDSENDA